MLEVVYLSTAVLKPYERNARKHEEKDIDAIVNSIKQFGFNDPIGVWGKDNLIVEGHGRLLAAQKLGMTEVPCIRLDALTDEQRRAYALAHNKTAELSVWDWDALGEELDSITDIDMESLGFSSISADDLDEFFEGDEQGKTKKDAAQVFGLMLSFEDETELAACENMLLEAGYQPQRI